MPQGFASLLPMGRPLLRLPERRCLALCGGVLLFAQSCSGQLRLGPGDDFAKLPQGVQRVATTVVVRPLGGFGDGSDDEVAELRQGIQRASVAVFRADRVFGDLGQHVAPAAAPPCRRH